MQTSESQAPERQQDFVIGYSVMGNGSTVAIMMPNVPGAREFTLNGKDITATAGPYKIRLCDVPESVRAAQATGQVLIVGVDAFTNPVSEHELISGLV